MKRLTWLSAEDPPDRFPPLSQALDDPPGLLAGGGDLSPERLLEAYRRGIFPWYSRGQPVLWWSPDPREVLFPAELHRSHSMKKTLRSGVLAVTRNTAFAEVIGACAAARAGATGTWITEEMRAAYLELHRRGAALSFETRENGVLVGGLYGVHVGRLFCGESMFSHRSDASKVALSALVDACPALGVELIDCQMPSPHLRSLGSRPIPRHRFVEYLPR